MVKVKSLGQHLLDVDSIQQAASAAYEAQSAAARQKPAGHLSHCTRDVQLEGHPIPLNTLNGILGLEDSGVWVEPGVTMRQLLDWTVRQGLVPPVVAEFQEITVGGAIMGAALESSSFRYGQFNDSCSDYVLVLADGSKVRTSAHAHPQLHAALAGSYGTLATLVAARVELKPAKLYVKLSYQLLEQTEAVAEAIDTTCDAANPPDYVDAIVFDAKRIVLMVGRLVDTIEAPLVRFNRPWHRWFVHHVHAKVESALSDDTIPLRDYLFRYDRAAFWMGQFCTSPLAMLRFLFSWRLDAPGLVDDLHRAYDRHPPTLFPGPLFRMCMGARLSSSSLYRTLHCLPHETLVNMFHVQDFYIPLAKLTVFLNHLEKHVGIYPLWLCPVKGASDEQFLSSHHLSAASRSPRPDFVNVGVYGIPANGRPVPDVIEELEELTHSLGGRKMLYATNRIPEERFWQIYDKEYYASLRQDVFASGILPDLYSKTT